jgi:hypothetical protein
MRHGDGSRAQRRILANVSQVSHAYLPLAVTHDMNLRNLRKSEQGKRTTRKGTAIRALYQSDETDNCA